MLSVGALFTEKNTGIVVEIVGTSPKILYSPVTTFNTTIYNSRIFQRTADDFLSRYTEGGSPQPFVYDEILNQYVTDEILGGSVLQGI